MKRSVVIFSFLFLFVIYFVSCASASGGITNQVDSFSGAGFIKNIGALDNDDSKWNYLSSEWKKILLENNFVLVGNALLEKFSLVFKIFTGEYYSLSLTFLFVLVFWFFFFVNFKNILNNGVLFEEGWRSWIGGIVLASILGNLHFYRVCSEMVFNIIFYKGGIWGWVGVLGLLLFLFLIIQFVKQISLQIKKGRKQSNVEFAQRGIIEFFKSLRGKSD